MPTGFGEASWVSSPFRYATWKNFLPESVYTQVEQELYAYEFGQETLLNAHEDCYPEGQTHMCPSLSGFRDIWYVQLKPWLIQTLGWPDSVPCRVDVSVHVDGEGFSQGAHRDMKPTMSPLGYGTLQIYFGNSQLADTGAWVGEPPETQIPFERNRAWGFLAGPDTWHSVKTIKRPVDRRSIMINLRSQ